MTPDQQRSDGRKEFFSPAQDNFLQVRVSLTDLNSPVRRSSSASDAPTEDHKHGSDQTEHICFFEKLCGIYPTSRTCFQLPRTEQARTRVIFGVGSPMQLPVNERETHHLPQFFSPPSPLFPGKFNAPSLSSLLLSSNGERCKEKVFRQRLLCTTMSLKRNENVFNNTFFRDIKGSTRNTFSFPVGPAAGVEQWVFLDFSSKSTSAVDVLLAFVCAHIVQELK